MFLYDADAARSSSNDERNLRGSKDKEFAEFVACSLEMYIDRDWGDTCADDAYANDDAMEKGDARVVAKYNHIFRNIFIITEWDRSVTTILFCHEY